MAVDLILELKVMLDSEKPMRQEIEVTEEMIQAGAEVIKWYADSWLATRGAEALYRHMENAR